MAVKGSVYEKDGKFGVSYTDAEPTEYPYETQAAAQTVVDETFAEETAAENAVAAAAEAEADAKAKADEATTVETSAPDAAEIARRNAAIEQSCSGIGAQGEGELHVALHQSRGSGPADAR